MSPFWGDQGHGHSRQESSPLGERGWAGTDWPWASHRPLPPPPPPPPPPPWPPASGAPDIMRKRMTGMMYIHCGPDRRTGHRTDRHRETEKGDEYEQHFPQGGEGGDWREGKPHEERGPGPLHYYGWGRAGGGAGGQRREGAQSSLRPPAAMVQAQGQQDAGL